MTAAEVLPLDDSRTVTTPNGTQIYYQPDPRLYRVNGVEVPSVTTILGVLDKPALPWWGMKTGVEGVLELARRGAILPFTAYFSDEIVRMLTAHKLTVNHVRDRAGDRGVTVHDAFELWGITGELPDPSEFPEAERGYVKALHAFLWEAEIWPVATEVMVGSESCGFAGRYDLRATLGERVLTTKLGKGFAETSSKVPGGVYLIDLKTAKGVYNSNFLQLEAYEGASIECGYQPTDYRAVLHVCADGRYELVTSKARYAEFLAVRSAYAAMQALKERQK